MTAIPGLIDQHIHITGGGGEGGFNTKVPEITLSKLIELVLQQWLDSWNRF